jgi:SAM-dependent methyltransferase
MLAAYTAGDYFEGGSIGYDSYARQQDALRTTFERVTRGLVRAGASGGDLLEIGSGYGLFLDAARPAFRSLLGTEYSEAAAASARSRGHDVRVGGVEAVPGERTFDCIVATHVVEHVYDPRAYVARLLPLLRPGGRVLLATPDMGSAWRQVMGRRWPSFKPPEHVLYFDRRTLRALLVDGGFEDIRPFPYLHSFPLGLILRKLGARSPERRLGRVGEIAVPLPWTTLALIARKPRRPDQG